MAVQGKFETITVVAGADLSAEALQYTAITVAGVIATTSTLAFGLNQAHPESGDHMTLAYKGHMKGRAGAAIAKGEGLQVAAGGLLIPLVAIDSGLCVGKALSAAGASGDLFEFIGDFT